jgi:hypothetical protein
MQQMVQLHARRPCARTGLSLGAYLGPVELVECFADLDWAAD